MFGAFRDRRLAWLLLTAMETSLAFAAVAHAQAGEIVDGTPLQVRLLHAIHSDTARIGQILEFEVVHDVIIRNEVVIKKGTIATGQITDARAARWTFLEKHPRLAFKFILTTASDGTAVALRASAPSGGVNRVVLDRGDHRELLWASEADVFDAYVSGNYGVRDTYGEKWRGR
jgi:hypothetical protein